MTYALKDLLNFLKTEAPELAPRLLHSGSSLGALTFTTVVSNTQNVEEGSLFFALVGSHADAHQFIPQAIAKGASVIFVQDGRFQTTGEESAAVVRVSNTTEAFAFASAFFHGIPAKTLQCVGVTGTNGKTTVTHLIEKLLKASGKSVGLIGTLGVRHSNSLESGVCQDAHFVETGHTTPLADALQAHLAEMKADGIESVVMEVSSHALDQYRTATVDFQVGVITNLTQDHLDYHITMEKYAEAKAQLFKRMAQGKSASTKTAVINVDDPWHEHFINACPAGVSILRFGIHHPLANIRAKNVRFTIEGSSFDLETPLGRATMHIKLAGEFSVYNALAAVGAGIGLGLDLPLIVATLQAEAGVHGRFEVIHQAPYVIVDYAHTPDGLDNVLKSAQAVLPEGGQLIAVFGCGGDRDATKRPKMAAIAEKWANKMVITSDNPRTEDPEQIIADILTGLQEVSPEKIKVISDRATAIATALDWATPKDIVVLAGKGHETYQILATSTIDFDDTKVALAHLKAMRSS